MPFDEQGIYRFREFYIPERMIAGIRAYVEEHRSVGHFLQSIICNNLSDAVNRADEENLRNLPAYVGYFYNEAPSSCWGSRKKMEKWLYEENDHEE